MERINIHSGTYWEDIVGYSRAVKVGNFIEVSGTVAANDDGELVGEKNPFQQTFFIIEKIESCLKQLDATLEDVTRLRIYLTNIKDWEEIAKAILTFFGNIRPACTIVSVTAFVDPKYLVEIEATAIK
jgi:enamine deaminase RidA (YjgF/YER057c/UK114 family)